MGAHLFLLEQDADRWAEDSPEDFVGQVNE